MWSWLPIRAVGTVRSSACVRGGSNRRDCYVLDEIDRLNEQAQSILLSLCGHQCACFLMTAHALDQVSEALTQRSECIEMAEVPPPLLMPWVRAISRELGHELGDTRLFSAILRCRGRLGRIISSLELEADLLHVEAGAEEH